MCSRSDVNDVLAAVSYTAANDNPHSSPATSTSATSPTPQAPYLLPRVSSSTLSDRPDRRDPARHDTDGENPLFALQSRIWSSPLHGNRGKRPTRQSTSSHPRRHPTGIGPKPE